MGALDKITNKINQISSGKTSGRKVTDDYDTMQTMKAKPAKDPNSGAIAGYGFKAETDRIDAAIDAQSGSEHGGAGGGLGRLHKANNSQ